MSILKEIANKVADVSVTSNTHYYKQMERAYLRQSVTVILHPPYY